MHLQPVIRPFKCLDFFERTVIGPLFQDFAVADCRLADDNVGIFTDDGSESFESCECCLNKVCKLD